MVQASGLGVQMPVAPSAPQRSVIAYLQKVSGLPQVTPAVPPQAPPSPTLRPAAGGAAGSTGPEGGGVQAPSSATRDSQSSEPESSRIMEFLRVGFVARFDGLLWRAWLTALSALVESISWNLLPGKPRRGGDSAGTRGKRSAGPSVPARARERWDASP